MNELMKIEFPKTVSNITELASNTAQELMDAGEIDPVEIMVKIKQIETYLDCLKSNLKSYAVDHADKRKMTTAGGAKIEVRSPGKYDFTYCNDPQWNSYQAKNIEIEALRKARERFLKGVTKTVEITDTDTGEMYTINPPVKTANETLYITLEK